METAATSCLRFLESQASKYYQLLRTGDVASERHRHSKRKVDEQFRDAKALIAQGVTRKEAAAIVGMNYQTLTKRLNNEK